MASKVPKIDMRLVAALADTFNNGELLDESNEAYSLYNMYASVMRNVQGSEQTIGYQGFIDQLSSQVHQVYF